MRFALCSVLLVMTAAPSALADPCKTGGSTSAVAIASPPAPANAPFNKALARATQPETVSKAIDAVAEACTRAGHLYGEDWDAMPRIWKVPGSPRDDIAFLIRISQPQPGRAKIYYALVRSFGSGAVLVSALFNGVPDDARARKLMSSQFDGGFEPLEFDAKTGALVDKNGYLPGQLAKAKALAE